MALRCALLPDPVRGPGHGLLTIAPLAPSPPVVRFSLQHNQGGDSFLGPEGRWRATVYEHEASAEASEGGVRIALGPWFVDAITDYSMTRVYQLSVHVATGTDSGRLRVDRQLLGSKAEGRTPAKPPVELVVEEPREPEPTVVEAAPVVMDVPAPPPRPRSRLPLVILSVLVLAAVGLGAWLWWDCRIPGVGPGRCGAPLPSPPSPLPPAPVADPATCAGLDAKTCLTVAMKAFEARRLEPARQLLQQAAKLGATEASLQLAAMYDPKTWSAERSPVEQPDWDTASYWYEEAARGGEPRGMIGAGRLYCQFATDRAFIERGLQWLHKAATSPDVGSEAQDLLKSCEAKAP